MKKEENESWIDSNVFACDFCSAKEQDEDISFGELKHVIINKDIGCAMESALAGKDVYLIGASTTEEVQEQFIKDGRQQDNSHIGKDYSTSNCGEVSGTMTSIWLGFALAHCLLEMKFAGKLRAPLLNQISSSIVQPTVPTIQIFQPIKTTQFSTHLLWFHTTLNLKCWVHIFKPYPTLHKTYLILSAAGIFLLLYTYAFARQSWGNTSFFAEFSVVGKQLLH